MSLDLEAIRDSNGQKTTELDVPELDGKLRVRMMSGTDLFRVTEHARRKPDDVDGQVRLLFIACVIDEQGKPLFTSQTVKALMDKPSAMVMRLSEQIQGFCGMLDEDGEDDPEGN